MKCKSIIDLVKEEITQDDTFQYCKIDLEGYDQIVLEDLFHHSVFPDFLSFECHSLEPLELVIKSGAYLGFKVVEGANVGKSLATIRRSISGSNSDSTVQEFQIHSSGPWGRDVPGPWLSRRGIKFYFLLSGTGWRDVHATKIVQDNPRFMSSLYIKLVLKQFLLRVRYRLRIRTRSKSLIASIFRK